MRVNRFDDIDKCACGSATRQVVHRDTNARRSRHVGGADTSLEVRTGAPRSIGAESETTAIAPVGTAMVGRRSQRDRSGSAGCSSPGAGGASSTAHAQSSPQRQSPPQQVAAA
jgi:hypothetical protein